MEHLSKHPHALINENNVVTDIFVFDEHNSNLLNQIKENFDAKNIICCCDNGIAVINSVWDGTQFIPPSPYPSWVWNLDKWEPPVPCPEGTNYIWDELQKNWVTVVLS
jgi:hypothetical protein